MKKLLICLLMLTTGLLTQAQQAEFEVSDSGSAYPCLIIQSPGGKRFYITINENGILETTEGGITTRHTVIKTGTYTGDGTTSQAITGTGVRPIFAQVFERITVANTALSMFMTIPEIMDDHVDGGAVAAVSTDPEHKFRKNAIISLDADGFTVDDGGTDLHPNKLNQIYNYWVIGY